jgi:hypothetical protein
VFSTEGGAERVYDLGSLAGIEVKALLDGGPIEGAGYTHRVEAAGQGLEEESAPGVTQQIAPAGVV